MLNLRERKKVVKALPKNGYQLISEKLEGEFTSETIRKYMNNPKHKYNAKVFTAALEVIEDNNAIVEAHRARIKNLPA